MKKYAVMVLAVMLVGMSSCAYARVEVQIHSSGSTFYVGDELNVRISASLVRSNAADPDTWQFQII